MEDNAFSYTSNYAGQVYVTDRVAKADDSSAIIAYTDGPAMGSTMYVEIWGAKNWNETFVNHTYRRGNGITYKYCTVQKGQQAFIPNLVYETYRTSAFTELRVYITTTGAVSGKWSPTTR